jgi:hypothetical protein
MILSFVIIRFNRMIQEFGFPSHCEAAKGGCGNPWIFEFYTRTLLRYSFICIILKDVILSVLLSDSNVR